MLAIINNFNLLTWPKKMAEKLSENTSIEVLIVDNNSTYIPLLEWYDNCPFKVTKLTSNQGHRAGLQFAPDNDFFIYTDPDLDISSIPPDWLDNLMEGCLKYDCYKCGFGLETNDLPDFPLTYWIKVWEGRWWNLMPEDNRFFNADIDTTFALYNPKSVICRQLRTNRPYMAKHLPWYLNPLKIDEEYTYYLDHIETETHWGKALKKRKDEGTE